VKSTAQALYVGGNRVAGSVLEADGALDQLRGLAGRGLDEDEAAIIHRGKPASQLVHMLGVPEPLQVVVARDGRVRETSILSPWVGAAWVRGDIVLEVPPRVPVEIGDHVALREPEEVST